MARPEELLNNTLPELDFGLEDFDDQGNYLPPLDFDLEDATGTPPQPEQEEDEGFSLFSDTQRENFQQVLSGERQTNPLELAYELTGEQEVGEALKEFTLAFAEGARNRHRMSYDPFGTTDPIQYTDSQDWGDNLARGLGDVAGRVGVVFEGGVVGGVTGGVGGALAGGVPGAIAGTIYGAGAGMTAALGWTAASGAMNQTVGDVEEGVQKIKQEEGRDATPEERQEMLRSALPFRLTEEAIDTILLLMGAGWAGLTGKAAKAQAIPITAERVGKFYTLAKRSIGTALTEGFAEGFGGAGARAGVESVRRADESFGEIFAEEFTSPRNVEEMTVATGVGLIAPGMASSINIPAATSDPEVAALPAPEPRAALPYDPGQATLTEVPDDAPLDDYTATDEGLRIAGELVERGELEDPAAAQAVYLSRVIGELENPYSPRKKVFIPTEIISTNDLIRTLEKDTHLRVTPLSDNDGYTKVEVIPGAPTQVDRFFARQEEQRKNLEAERDTLANTLRTQQKLYEQQLEQDRELNEQMRSLKRQIKKAPLEERAELKKQLQDLNKNYADLLTKMTSSEDAVMNSRIEDRIGKLDEEIGMIDAVTKATDDLDALRLLPQTENTLPKFKQLEQTIQQEVQTKRSLRDNLLKRQAALEKALKRLETYGVKDTRFSNREAKRRAEVQENITAVESALETPPISEPEAPEVAPTKLSRRSREVSPEQFDPRTDPTRNETEARKKQALQNIADKLYTEKEYLDAQLAQVGKSLREKTPADISTERFARDSEEIKSLEERLSDLQTRNREAEQNISGFKDFLTSIREQDAETRKGTFERAIRTEGDLLSRANRERTRLDSLDTESAQLRAERSQIDDDILSIEKQKEQLEVKRAADEAGSTTETLTDDERDQLIDLDEEANRLAQTQLLIDEQLRGIQTERTRVADFLNTLENRLNPRTEQITDQTLKYDANGVAYSPYKPPLNPNEYAQWKSAFPNNYPEDIKYSPAPTLDDYTQNAPTLNRADVAAQKNIDQESQDAQKIVELVNSKDENGKSPTRLATLGKALKRKATIDKDWAKRKWVVDRGLGKEIYTAFKEAGYELDAEKFAADKSILGLQKALQDLSEDARLDVDDPNLNLALASDPQALAKLPDSVRTSVSRMRKHIKELSKKFIDRGIAQGDLVATIADNLDVYLHRSYALFHDPTHIDKVMENAPVLNAGIAQMRKMGMIPEGATEAEVQNIVRGFLETTRASGSILNAYQAAHAGTGLGKNMGIFKKRGDIPIEIQHLFGVYEGILDNYARTVTELATHLSRHKMLDAVLTIGEKQGLISKNIDTTRGITTPIAKGNSYEPLAEWSPIHKKYMNTYATPEFAAAVSDYLDSPNHHWFIRSWLGINAVAKINKTVFNPPTQGTNFFGNSFLVGAVGGIPISPDTWKTAMQGLNMYFSTDEAATNAHKKWVRFGYTSGGMGGEIQALFKDAQNSNSYTDFAIKWLEKYAPRTAEGLKLPIKLYQASDTFWKILRHEHEVKTLQKFAKWKDRPLSEIEQEAARIVRNEMPTYENAPEAIQAFRAIPFAPSFPTFFAQIYQNLGNFAKTTNERIRSEDPEERKSGMQRLVGITAMLALPDMAAYAMNFFSGEDEEEVDAIRELGPSYRQRSAIGVVGRDENGNPITLDLDRMNPYRPILGALHAVFDPDLSAADKAKAVVMEMFDPFLSEGIVMRKIMDVGRNKSEISDRPIYNEDLEWYDSVPTIYDYIVDLATPGGIEWLSRIKKGMMEETSRSGKPYSVPAEFLSMSGARADVLPLDRKKRWKASEHATSYANATSEVSRVFARQGTTTPEEIRDTALLYKKLNNIIFEKTQRTINNFRILGIPDDELYNDMSAGDGENGLSKKKLTFLMQGRKPPAVLSKQMLDKIYKIPGRAEMIEEVLGAPLPGLDFNDLVLE